MSVIEKAETLPVKIKIGPTGVQSLIEIGGIDMSPFATAFRLSASAGGITRLTVRFIKVEINAEGFVDTTAVGDLWENYRRAKDIKEGARE